MQIVIIQKCQIWNENKNLYLKNETHTCTKIRENDALKRKDSTEATSENFLASYLIRKCKEHLMLQIIITCILVIEKTYNIGNILLMEKSLSEATTFWIFCDSKLTNNCYQLSFIIHSEIYKTQSHISDGTFFAKIFNPLMHNVPKWSMTL